MDSVLILNSFYLGKSVHVIRTSLSFMDVGTLEVNTSIPNFKNEASLWLDFTSVLF